MEQQANTARRQQVRASTHPSFRGLNYQPHNFFNATDVGTLSVECTYCGALKFGSCYSYGHVQIARSYSYVTVRIAQSLVQSYSHGYAPINCNPQYGIHRGFIREFTYKVTPSSGAFDTSIFYNNRIV